MDLLRKVKAFAVIAALCMAASAVHGKAAVSVGGFGLFGNAELRNSLRLLEFQEGKLTAKKIDDGAFLLLTRLTQNGYLDATLSAQYTTSSGEEQSASWSAPFEPQISDGVIAAKLHYEVHPGMLYYYDDISIEGLTAIPEEEALEYFVPSRALFSRKKDRSYSPNILSGHRKQLVAALSSLGYTDAKITVESTDIDRETGEVDLDLVVEEGPLYKVVEAKVVYSQADGETRTETMEVDHVYSKNWTDVRIRELRTEAYRRGFPDTRVTSRVAKTEPVGDIREVSLVFEVKRGRKVTVSGIEHIGATDTHTPLLNRKVDLSVGEPLDITEAERSRRRLSALGIFERIDLRYTPTDEGERKVIYEYTQGRRIEAQLLVGYGSYESLRAGFIARRENLFGRAHSMHFEAIQSLKSTTGRLDYKIPDLFGESIDGTIEARFLDRQELYFDRRERGVSVGLSKRFTEINTDVGIDYAFERKRSSDPEFNEEFGLEDANVGSVSFRATKSTIDNILYPKNGYELSAALQYAAKELGGEKEFIKPEIGAAYHRPIGNRWLFHVSARGGLVTDPSGDDSDILPNDRFLIGGENSLRGYRRGEAGPLEAETGVPLNAKAYALLNVEVEYPVFDKLYVVLFSDAARSWRPTEDLDDYEDLYNVGIGFRYQTIVGPVRLEYGHNLNPRPEDPDGTVHLSVGFPF